MSLMVSPDDEVPPTLSWRPPPPQRIALVARFHRLPLAAFRRPRPSVIVVRRRHHPWVLPVEAGYDKGRTFWAKYFWLTSRAL